MDALLEAIFGNFMIIIIIIGGIISFLKNKSGNEQQEKRRHEKTQRTRTQVPSGRYDPAKQRSEQQMHQQSEDQHHSDTEMITAEEQRAAQLKNLAGKIESDLSTRLEELPEAGPVKHTEKKPVYAKSAKHRPEAKHFRKNLTGKGLVQSVVMAEVLGPPKATRPYRPVTEERRRK